MASIFISYPTINGYTWTITSKLGHILDVAESKFGKRDKSYTILGVELNQAGHPQIWYPSNNKNLIIQISLNCIDDINRAVFQVAHEAIHCLSPTGNRTANILEEGLANLFAIQYTLEYGHGFWNPNDQRYKDASQLVEQLLAIDSEIVYKARIIEPTISMIDRKVLQKVNSSIPDQLAEKLSEPFV